MQKINEDTVFCFTIDQSKSIAKYIVELNGCRSEVKQYQRVLGKTDSLLFIKDQQINLLKLERLNSLEITNVNEDMVKGLGIDLDNCNKERKKYKLITKISLICIGLLGGIAIIK